MKIDNPQMFTSYADVLKWAKSVYKALNSGLAFAIPQSKDATGAYAKFVQDNINGVMVRIGAHGTGQVYTWSGVTGVGTTVIRHGLQAQPTGFIVCDVDKACNVYRTAPPTKDTITLGCSDSTTNVTVLIF